MEEDPIYRKIADTFRRDILEGRLKPGQRLPSVREISERWNCTIGTAQHAYRELGSLGLVTSRAGQGTRVVEPVQRLDETPLRRAMLVHRAEAFLLEVLTSGHSLDEVENSMRLAMDRWRQMEQSPQPAPSGTLRFAGSHDLAVAWLAGHFPEISTGYSLQLNFSGSLGGLIALAEGQAELAGSHLWDEESDTYNAPFVRRLLPGRRVALVTVSQRRLGLILPAGNPQGVVGLPDLAHKQLRFANRQPGSGTRVWLDAMLKRAGMEARQIPGYEVEAKTHSAVARRIAEGQADAGLGLEAAARALGLDFVLLTLERYDLVIPEEAMQLPAVQAVVEWLQTPSTAKTIASLGGYETGQTGQVTWL